MARPTRSSTSRSRPPRTRSTRASSASWTAPAASRSSTRATRASASSHRLTCTRRRPAIGRAPSRRRVTGRGDGSEPKACARRRSHSGSSSSRVSGATSAPSRSRSGSSTQSSSSISPRGGDRRRRPTSRRPRRARRCPPRSRPPRGSCPGTRLTATSSATPSSSRSSRVSASRALSPGFDLAAGLHEQRWCRALRTSRLRPSASVTIAAAIRSTVAPCAGALRDVVIAARPARRARRRCRVRPRSTGGASTGGSLERLDSKLGSSNTGSSNARLVDSSTRLVDRRAARSPAPTNSGSIAGASSTGGSTGSGRSVSGTTPRNASAWVGRPGIDRTRERRAGRRAAARAGG